MANRKTIRGEQKAGTFTCVHNSILLNKKLSSDAKILLITLLSDNDSFTLIYSSYEKKLGFSSRKLNRLMNELIENGFIKRTVKGSMNLYIISEFGNLNNKEVEEIHEDMPSVDNIQTINEEPKIYSTEEKIDWIKYNVPSMFNHLFELVQEDGTIEKIFGEDSTIDSIQNLVKIHECGTPMFIKKYIDDRVEGANTDERSQHKNRCYQYYIKHKDNPEFRIKGGTKCLNNEITVINNKVKLAKTAHWDPRD